MWSTLVGLFTNTPAHPNPTPYSPESSPFTPDMELERSDRQTIVACLCTARETVLVVTNWAFQAFSGSIVDKSLSSRFRSDPCRAAYVMNVFPFLTPSCIKDQKCRCSQPYKDFRPAIRHFLICLRPGTDGTFLMTDFHRLLNGFSLVPKVACIVSM